MKRRFFLFAAPAIVAAPSLMRVSAAVLGASSTDAWLSHVAGYYDDAALPTTLGDLITQTLRVRSGQLAEQVMKNNAILKVMRDKNYTYLVDESRLIYKPWRETEQRLVTNS